MKKIAQIINEKNLTQKEAAKILGIKQGRVSELINGKLSLFSLERLCHFLNSLEADVEIIIKPKAQDEKKASINLVFGV